MKTKSVNKNNLPKSNACRDSKRYSAIKQSLKTVDNDIRLFRLIAELMSIPSRVLFKPTKYDTHSGAVVDGKWVRDKSSVKNEITYIPSYGQIEGVRLTEKLQKQLKHIVDELADRPCIYQTAPTNDYDAPVYTIVVSAESICTGGGHNDVTTYSTGLVFRAVKATYNVL